MRRLSLLVLGLLAPLLTMEVTQAQTVGRTAGQFAVSPTGAATYTIPIWSPHGPKGLQPQIALVYSSQQGNGYLGVGWNLAGISSISRCNLTYAQDGAPAPVSLTIGDGYCLDGQRLRLTSGTYGTAGSTYQTEIANFQNVTAYGAAGNGPAYFIVQTPDGKTLQYGEGGTTSNAQVLASGTSTALSWMLNEVSDSAGNTMTISYCASGAADPNCPSPGLIGVALPDTISWTPTTHGASTYAYTMKFSYGANTLPTTGFVAGTPVQNPYLLGSIIVSSGGAQVKEYDLTYQQSGTTGRDLLTQVQECAASQSNCLYPTTINYESGMAGISASPNIGINTPVTSCVTTCGALAHYDFNGDGYTDLYYCTSGGCFVEFGSASGFGEPVAAPSNALFGDLLGNGQPGILANNGGTWYYYTWNGSSFTSQTTNLAYDSLAVQFALVDINGDGKPDLESFYASSGVTVTTRLNTSSTTSPSFDGTAVTALSDPGMTWYGAFTQDNQWGSSSSFDFNGDGMPDILLREYNCVSFIGGACAQYITYYNALIAQPGGTLSKMFVFDLLSLDASQVIFANVNNDACTDVVYQYTVYISSCNGAPAGSMTTMWPVVAVMDSTGDGLSDFVENSGGFQSGANLYIQPSTGSGNIVNTNIAYSTFCTYVAFRANGDGRDNLGCVDGAPGSNGFTYYLHNGTGTPPDLLTSIVDGYGNSASPTYASIVQSNYAGGAGTFPDVAYLQPIYVAKSVTYSDPSSPSGGTYSQTFFYFHSFMNVQGRGWDGFYDYGITDGRTGLTEWVGHWIPFPYTGLSSFDDVDSGSQAVSEWTGTTGVITLSSTPNQQRYFPYFSNITTKHWEVGGPENGDLITTLSTNYTYDSYGNATAIAKTVTDNDPNSPYSGDTWTTTTNNIPDVSTGTWCLNLFTQSQVAYTVSTGATVTRTKQFTPDLTNCRYSQIVTEPTSDYYEVTEALDYDSFGNVNNDSVTGIGMAARTASLNWGTTGQFPMNVTDPSGASTQINYNFNYGVVSNVKDPNNLTTSWLYDGFGRKTQETRPDGTYTTWAYTDMPSAGYSFHGLMVAKSTYGTNAALIRNDDSGHDSVGRLVVQADENLSGGYDQFNITYDSLGRVASRSAPCTWVMWPTTCPYWTTTSYDVLNRPTQVQRPISSTNSAPETTAYGYAGRTTTVTDPNGHAKTTIKDVNGLLREALDANGYAVTTSYDAAGSKTGIVDNQGRSLWSGEVQYGVVPFTVSTTDSALGGRSYTFDALGEVTNYADTNGHAFSIMYDALSRPVSRTEPDLFTQWTWGSTAANDNIGKLATVCTGNSASPGVTPTACTANSTTVPGYSEIDSFDSVGRPVQRSITLPGDGTFAYGYQYNTSGQLGTLTYPTTIGTSLQLQYNYSNGIPQSIVDVAPDAVTLWTADAKNSAGQLTQETLGNGVVINHSFEPVTRWLNSITAGVGGGAVLENQSYAYDLVGNVTQRQENNLGLTENFYYDSLNRLYYSQLNSVTNLQMCYDNAGGSCTENVPGPGTITSKSADAVAPSSYAATWTSYNYPSKIATTSEQVQFLYGPDRRRWQQNYNNNAEITNYIGGLLEQVVTPSGTSYRQYVYAGAEPVAVLAPSSSGNTVTYILSDQVGSVAALLGSSGTSDVGESFTAYGARRNPSTWSGAPSSGDLTTIAGLTRQGYTFQTALGQSMGFNHMNGRVQDAITGQFLSPDPNIPDPTNTQDYNRYAYVDNSALTLMDPSGFGSCTVTECVVTPDYQNPDAGSYVDFETNGNVWNPTMTAAAAEWLAENQPQSVTVMAPKPKPPALPQPQTKPPCSIWTRVGNAFESWSDTVGQASTALEVAGAAVTIGGLAAQPEINPVADGAVVFGGGMMASGGAGGIVATALQVSGGIAQMIGGNTSVGGKNAVMGAISMMAAAGLGQLGQITMPASTAAGRAFNSALGRGMAFAGTAADVGNQFTPAMSPAQSACGP